MTPPKAASSPTGSVSGVGVAATADRAPTPPATRAPPALSGSSRPSTPPAPSSPLSASSFQRRVKGKQRAEPVSPTSATPPRAATPPSDESRLSLALGEALSTSLIIPSSPLSPSAHAMTNWAVGPHSPSLTPPPAAHHPAVHLTHNSLRPRLVSQLTRATLPTSSLSYANAEEDNTWHLQHDAPMSQGESSMSWLNHTSGQCASPKEEEFGTGSGFPDLDPATGLPMPPPSPKRRRASSDAPSLHLQRTITDLSRSLAKAPPTPSLPLIGPFPSLQPLLRTAKSSIDLGPRRNLSTTSAAAQNNNQSGDWTNWATGWWPGNKEKVDSLLTEADKAATVEEEQAKHQIKYRTPVDPLVFCHGLLGFDYLGPSNMPPLQISHWRGIREVLQANGCEVMIARVPATSSIQDRAAILNDLIAEKYPGRTVNLVGHSMGGLDCRYLVSGIKPTKFKIATLTTISTPHRGSPFADYVIDDIVGRERLPQLLSMVDSLSIPNQGDGSAFQALGTRAMKQFNTEIIDDPNVKYYSWGASFEPGIFDTFRWPHSVIMGKEGPNDGMVSVNSARWGEYRGTLLGVNHLDLVGWVNTVRYMFSGLTGKPITFKPATFYLEVADFLAEQGY